LFVSGSLDGSIVLWQSETLTPLRVLEFPEKYFENHSYISPVNHFALLSSVRTLSTLRYAAATTPHNHLLAATSVSAYLSRFSHSATCALLSAEGFESTT
jgi:hypothetical protein